MTTRLRARAVGTVLAAWLLSLGFDLLLHAGLLARVYLRPSAFLLRPEQAFARIPLGYLGFLVLTVALYWLYSRLHVRGWLDGFRFGIFAGLVLWGALALGLYSITTAAPELLLGWWVGQAFELGLAGAVIGAAFAGTPLKTIYWKVVAAVLLMLVVVILMQSLGVAPAMKMAAALVG